MSFEPENSKLPMIEPIPEASNQKVPVEENSIKPKTRVLSVLSWLLVGFTGLALIAGGIFWWSWAPEFARARLSATETAISNDFLQLIKQAAEYQPPIPSEISVNTLFFGDVFWGRYVHEWSQASELKEAYPFSGLNTFERDKYQAWIGSLNCPITPEKLSAAQQEDLLKFNCTPEYLPEAAKWFTAFSLANSHTANMEEVDGFAQTRTRLEEAGVQYFGHFDKSVEDDICEVLSFEAKVAYNETEIPDLIKAKTYYIPVAICGYHNTLALPTESQIAQISKYSAYFPTLVYAIQGSEYNTSADGLQRDYFKRMIDAGGDAVIGKGAHVVQDSEAYKGKLIVYSMGNFIYDQQFSPDVRQGISLNAKITISYNQNLVNWQKIAQNCQVFKDKCLDSAKSENLAKIDFKMSYDFFPTDNSGKLAKKGDENLRQKMSQRLGWEKTLAGLK